MYKPRSVLSRVPKMSTRWLVAAAIPDIPHPILLLNGPAGAGKTTTRRA